MVKYSRGVLMKGIVAVVTYNCNIMCSSCSYGCGPHRKGVMSPENFKDRVTEAYASGYSDYLEISGGEPFLHTGMVFKYIKKIEGLDIKKSIVTNGYWGGQDYFFDILADLKHCGVDEIILEYDSFHSVFINQETILEAANKAGICGMKVRLRAGFETSSLSTRYDWVTLDIMRSLRKRHNKLIFECVSIEEYAGLYSNNINCHRRIILP